MIKVRRIVISIALIFIVAMLVINPILEEQQVLETQATTEYSVSDPTYICNVSRDQDYPSIWDDDIVWQDYRSGNWDIYGFNLQTTSNFSIDPESFEESMPCIYDNLVVYSVREFNGETWVYYLEVWDMDLLQIVNTIHNTSANVRYDLPRIYGDYIIYRSQNYANVYLYDLNSDTETVILDTTDSQFDYDIFGDKVVIHNWPSSSAKTYLYYNITTSNTINIESSVYTGSVPCAYGDYFVWSRYDSATPRVMSIYLYNTKTGTTDTLLTGDVDDIIFVKCVWDDVVVFSSYDYGDLSSTKLSLYSIDSEEIFHEIDVGDLVGYCDMYNDDFVFAFRDVNDDYNLLMATVSIVTPPSPPSPDGEAVQEFIQDYWAYLTVGIIGIAGVVAVEGYKYQWEHFKALNERVNIGLLASLIIIITIIGIWIGFGV